MAQFAPSLLQSHGDYLPGDYVVVRRRESRGNSIWAICLIRRVRSDGELYLEFGTRTFYKSASDCTLLNSISKSLRTQNSKTSK